MRLSLRDNFFSLALMAALAVASVATPAARAQYRTDLFPAEESRNTTVQKITDKAGAALPLDLQFTRYDGQPVKLGSLFNQGKPVILDLVYFSCPNLCGFNQDALKEAVLSGPRSLSLGKDYDIVIVSIDSDDTAADASKKRSKYLDLMNRKPDQVGFTYLTGSADNIKQLADAVGFPYTKNVGGGDKFAHDTGIFICTPEGKLSHTITGIAYAPDELHYRLVEASHNKIGSDFLSVCLTCGAIYFDPKTGRYEHNPWFYAGTATGLVSMLMVGGFLAFLWRSDTRRKHDPPVTELPAKEPQ